MKVSSNGEVAEISYCSVVHDDGIVCRGGSGAGALWMTDGMDYIVGVPGSVQTMSETATTDDSGGETPRIRRVQGRGRCYVGFLDQTTRGCALAYEWTRERASLRLTTGEFDTWTRGCV